jgi:ribose transport system ATP-binding protein
LAELLELRGIGKRFGATVALDDVSFGLNPGEVLALVGENGSGKSTLMRIVAGAIQPDSGSMQLQGATFAPADPSHARRQGVAMIYQELSLCPDLTVLENIVLGVEAGDDRSRAKKALERLGYGHLPLDRRVGELPIAARQIVEIARAVASEARIIILDEPTSSLTASDAASLFTVIESLRSDGRAIIYISHFLEEIARLADRIVILRDGVLVTTGPKTQFSKEDLVRLMVGRSISELYPRSARTPGEVVMSTQGLSGVTKPTDVTIEVRAGEVFGIAGLNGAGRTELLRLLFGLDSIRAGTMTPRAASPAVRWAQHIGLLSEDRKEEGLALGLSLADNLTLPALNRWLVSPRQQEATTQQWIQRLEVKCREPGQAIGELSGGNQQKIALARLLNKDCELMLLDEPTRGIDVGSKQLIYQKIDEAALSGKAVVLVSSYLPELLGVCDRIAVMRNGQLSEARPVSEWTAETLLAKALDT